MLTFLVEERDVEPHVLKSKIPTEIFNIVRSRLRRKESGSEQSKLKTPKSKASQSATRKLSKDTDKTEDDDEEDLEVMDFDLKKL